MSLSRLFHLKYLKRRLCCGYYVFGESGWNPNVSCPVRASQVVFSNGCSSYNRLMNYCTSYNELLYLIYRITVLRMVNHRIP